VIRSFQLLPSGLHGEVIADDAPLPGDALWIDLISAVAPLVYFRQRGWLQQRVRDRLSYPSKQVS